MRSFSLPFPAALMQFIQNVFTLSVGIQHRKIKIIGKWQRTYKIEILKFDTLTEKKERGVIETCKVAVSHRSPVTLHSDHDQRS